MRIGIFTETYTPYISGLVTSEVMLKKALEELGHTVYVVTANLKHFKYEYDEEEKILRIPGIKTGIYDSRLTSAYPIRAVNKIKSWKLDVIHSQTEFAIGTFARILSKQYNIPLVHTYHTMYEDYVHYITKGYFEKSSKKIVEYITKFYCDTTATELIVPTNKIYKLFKDKYKFEKNINIIPTGIETKRFYKKNIDINKLNNLKKKYKIKEDDYIILFVGRLAEEKNIEFLIYAQQKLVKENKKFKLFIVGDGPDREKYEKLSNELGLDKNVVFTGKSTWDDMPYYYNFSNIFVSASTSETQGLTIIEAFAASVPVVCILDEAFQSMVTDELNGLFFKNEEEYIEKILYFYNHKTIYKKYQKQALIASNNFSSLYYAEKILNVYERAIEDIKEKNRYGIFSSIRKKIKGDKNDNSTKQ